ncbi:MULTISPECIES: hypothetical protein [Burkholderia]|uniref:hypothetical protein n=1 Tax=Burkholderia TaxID=32008 RepID=UPI0005E7148B|nr:MULTISPECIES: hypothetical protein [Burkholderia]MDO5943329.1 hypothetical protein [Burkholderia cepacia]CAK1332124.1 Uncharacterised protein [Burkholderia pseudomallei]
MKTTQIATAATIFTVRTVLKGERYGRLLCLVHDEDEPMVEFYDYRQRTKNEHEPFGQFVSRYHIKTLRERHQQSPEGILLDTGSADWKLDARELQEVVDWLSTHNE